MTAEKTPLAFISSLLFLHSALHTRRPTASQRATNSYVQGAVDVPLLNKTVGQCLDQTAERFPDREAFVFFRDGVRKTFAQFKEEVSVCFACQGAQTGRYWRQQLRWRHQNWLHPLAQQGGLSSVHLWPGPEPAVTAWPG